MNLVERVVALVDALDRADIDWAIGGAVALAYATEEPRGTRDIDVNVFVRSNEVDRVFDALPTGVVAKAADRRAVIADDQVRLWWDDTPIDLFFAASDFHLEVAERARTVSFGGRHIRVLSPEDLAVFKAMFDRPKDWVDIDEMAASNALDRAVASRRLAIMLGPDDPRVARLASS